MLRRLRPLPLFTLGALVLGAMPAQAQVTWPYQLRLGFAWISDSVSSDTFSGTTPNGTGGTSNTRATGASLGFVHPSLLGAEAEATVGFGPWATLGFVGGFGLGNTPDAFPTNPALQQNLPPGTFREWQVGLAPGAHTHLRGSPVDLGLELRTGFRSQGFSILNVGQMPNCEGACTYSLNRSTWFLQPELRVGLALGEGFSVGCFFGVDVAPEPFHQFMLGLDLALSSNGF